jgi:DNA polymerase-1
VKKGLAVAGTTDIALHWVQTLDEAMALKRWLGERRPGGWLSVDTESTGLEWWHDRLRTVQFGDRHHGWTVEWSEWAGLVKECTEAYDGPVAYWNVKHDLHFLEHNGVKAKRWLAHDGRAMAHLQDPVRRTGLKPVAARVLGPWALHGESELKAAKMAGGWDWTNTPTEVEWTYSAFDTVITAQSCGELWPGIAAGYSGIYDLELASTMVLLDMETRGFQTDRGWMVKHADEWQQNADQIAVRLRDWLIGNPASDRQVIKALQEYLGWKPVVFTEKGNISLEREVLQGIQHPMADLVLEYRTNVKLQQYVEQHLQLADSNGLLHCSINPLGARTGRMSCRSPNLQNVPRDDKRIRKGFVAPPGHVLISADFDQIEGRLFAHYSGDQNMLQSIRYGDEQAALGRSGYDMHSMAARLVFSLGLNDPVPDAFRKQAKGIQFGKLYGAGLSKFMAMSGLSQDDAAARIAAYENQFPETKKSGFQSRVTSQLYSREKQTGEAYVLTAFGRKEPCWPSQAFKALNYLIQGCAADVMKDRMVALSKTWVGDHMLLPIHDELIFCVPEETAYDAVRVIKQVMPERERFAVPLSIDVEVSRRWGGELINVAA